MQSYVQLPTILQWLALALRLKPISLTKLASPDMTICLPRSLGICSWITGQFFPFFFNSFKCCMCVHSYVSLCALLLQGSTEAEKAMG